MSSKVQEEAQILPSFHRNRSISLTKCRMSQTSYKFQTYRTDILGLVRPFIGRDEIFLDTSSGLGKGRTASKLHNESKLRVYRKYYKLFKTGKVALSLEEYKV